MLLVCLFVYLAILPPDFLYLIIHVELDIVFLQHLQHKTYRFCMLQMANRTGIIYGQTMFSLSLQYIYIVCAMAFITP